MEKIDVEILEKFNKELKRGIDDCYNDKRYHGSLKLLASAAILSGYLEYVLEKEEKRSKNE
jgi:hypothetical protein